MTLHPRRWRSGEALAGLSAVALAIVLFLVHWYDPGPGTAYTGWQGIAHLRWLLLIAIILGLALLIAQAALRAPAVPVTLSVVSTVVSLLAVLWLVLRVIVDPLAHQRLGAWLALLAGLGLLVGSFRSLRQEGIAAEDGPGEIPVVDLSGAHPGSP